MIAPIRTLRKKDVEWLGTNRCQAHRHTYLEHYQCFQKEKPDTAPFQEKIGFFDIETTGLKADFHYVYSYALRADTGELYGRVLTRDEIRGGVFDRNLIKEIPRDLMRFQRIIVHWGTDRKFDFPFCRSRALHYHYKNFPRYKDLFVTDTWVMAKNKLCLRNNRLATVCEHLGIKAKSHPLTGLLWLQAGIGEPIALRYIWDHNVEDVDAMRDAYCIMEPYCLKGRKSI